MTATSSTIRDGNQAEGDLPDSTFHWLNVRWMWASGPNDYPLEQYASSFNVKRGLMARQRAKCQQSARRYPSSVRRLGHHVSQ